MRTRKLVSVMVGMFPGEWLGILDLSSSETRRLGNIVAALYIFLRSRGGEGGAELFSLVSSDRTYGSGS